VVRRCFRSCARRFTARLPPFIRNSCLLGERQTVSAWVCGSRSRPDTIWRLKVPSINRTSDREKSQCHRIILPALSPSPAPLPPPSNLYRPTPFVIVVVVVVFFHNTLSLFLEKCVCVCVCVCITLFPSFSVRSSVSLTLPHPFLTKYVYTYIYLCTTLAATETLVLCVYV